MTAYEKFLPVTTMEVILTRQLNPSSKCWSGGRQQLGASPEQEQSPDVEY
jgi:hypothetical protein